MEHERVAAALESLYDLLDEIDRNHADLSPANRSKITRAVCRLLTEHGRSAAGLTGPRMPRRAAGSVARR